MTSKLKSWVSETDDHGNVDQTQTRLSFYWNKYDSLLYSVSLFLENDSHPVISCFYSNHLTERKRRQKRPLKRPSWHQEVPNSFSSTFLQTWKKFVEANLGHHSLIPWFLCHHRMTHVMRVIRLKKSFKNEDICDPRHARSHTLFLSKNSKTTTLRRESLQETSGTTNRKNSRQQQGHHFGNNSYVKYWRPERGVMMLYERRRISCLFFQ